MSGFNFGSDYMEPVEGTKGPDGKFLWYEWRRRLRVVLDESARVAAEKAVVRESIGRVEKLGGGET